MKQQLTKGDVPGMLTAVIGLAKSGRFDLAPAWVDERDARIIGGHIGALEIRVTPTSYGWQMQCPVCREWDFGTTMDLHEAVETWLHGGHLPAGCLLGGACLNCEYITSPRARDIDLDVLEMLRELAGGRTRKATR